MCRVKLHRLLGSEEARWVSRARGQGHGKAVTVEGCHVRLQHRKRGCGVLTACGQEEPEAVPELSPWEQQTGPNQEAKGGRKLWLRR